MRVGALDGVFGTGGMGLEKGLGFVEILPIRRLCIAFDSDDSRDLRMPVMCEPSGEVARAPLFGTETFFFGDWDNRLDNVRLDLGSSLACP